jgi:hypothetical protein
LPRILAAALVEDDKLVDVRLPHPDRVLLAGIEIIPCPRGISIDLPFPFPRTDQDVKVRERIVHEYPSRLRLAVAQVELVLIGAVPAWGRKRLIGPVLPILVVIGEGEGLGVMRGKDAAEHGCADNSSPNLQDHFSQPNIHATFRHASTAMTARSLMPQIGFLSLLHWPHQSNRTF